MSYKISSFPVFKLLTVAHIQPGFAFKSDQFLDDDSQIPLVKGENLQQGYVDWKSSKYWRKDEYDDYEKYHLKQGDVVIAMDRPWVTAGLKWSYMKKHDPKSLLVQRVARLRAKTGLKQSYLRVLISSNYFASYVQPIVTGVNVPHISGKQIGDFKAPIPDEKVQQKIAAILAAYDDLIENNKRRIALLEKMAEEIYREWFVRFRFPGYQSAEFEKGIPKGWDQIKFGDFCTLKRGYDLPDSAVEPGDYPVIASTSVKTYHKTFKAKSPVITTGRSGSLGVVLMTHKNAWPLNTTLYVKDLRGNSPFLVYYTLKGMRLEQFNAGAGVPSLNRNHLSALKIYRPSELIQKKFDELIKPIFREIHVLEEVVENSTQTKNFLLPRLISGKLSVEELAIQFPPSMQDDAA